MKYRLYIDEVGNSDLRASSDPNHRYLSLTGVILGLEYVSTAVFPALEKLKFEFFGSHPDEPIILHRKEMVNRRHPFQRLREPAVEAAFNEALLGLLGRLDYVVLSVIVDKLEHQQRYQVWRYDPYHYGLAIMLERFVLWLQRQRVHGDVMAESRGRKEDLRLKNSFRGITRNGTDFMAPAILESCLTSLELKVKPKQANIAGLQLADILAHPSFKLAMARKEGRQPPENFGGRIVLLLEESKYDRSPAGKIEGWGVKWLP